MGSDVMRRGRPLLTDPTVSTAVVRAALDASSSTRLNVAELLGVAETSLVRLLRSDVMPAAKASAILDVIGVLPAEIGL